MKRFIIISWIIMTAGGIMAQQLLSLEDCRRKALDCNAQLRIAAETLNMAEQMKKAAFTRYLPSVSANAAYLWNEKNISLFGEDQYLPVGTKMADGSFGFTQEQVNNGWTLINGNPVPLDAHGVPFDPHQNPEKILWKNYTYIPKDAFEFDAQNIFTGAFTLTQPLFLGGKIRELNRIASYSKNLAKLQYSGTVSETLLEVDEAYWRVVSLENKEKLAKSYVDLLTRLDTDVQKSIAMGMATKSEGLSVKVKLNEATMMQIQVQDGLVLSRMALCRLIAMPLNSDIELTEFESGQQEPDAPSIPDLQAAVSRRYETGCLQQMVNISESNRKIMISRFLPNLVLSSGYMLSNPNMFNGFQKETAGMWQAGLVLNVPVFQWGERIHTLHAATSEKRIAEMKLQEAREKIELDITQASFKIREAMKKNEMVKSNLLKAEENLRFANAGFEAGMVTATALMEAQNAWLKANADRIDAGIELRLCRVYLEKATGNLQ